MSMRHTGAKPGFTLIELLITLALLSVVAGLSIASVTFLHRLAVRSEIDRLYATCMYVQRCAQVMREQQIITLDAQTGRYGYQGALYRLPKSVYFGTAHGVKGPPSTPHAVVVNPISFKKQCISFSPDGIIGAGTVYMTDSARSVVYALSSPIAQFSYLRRYQYDGSWRLIE